MDEKNVLLEVTGKADDLLMVNETEEVKGTRFFVLKDDTDPENEEVLDIAITSSNFGKGHEHPMFDTLLGKKLRVTVEEIE